MSTLKASRVSIILIASLIALLAVLIGGSAFAASLLLKQSKEATHAAIDTDISAGDTSRLEELKQYLAKNKDGISQTAALTAGLGSYTQSSIVSAINGYAGKAGVTITSFDFAEAAGTTSASATSSNTVTVTLASPVDYTKYIVFLRLIEQGLMPAQIVSGDVTGADDGQVSVSDMVIKVTR